MPLFQTRECVILKEKKRIALNAKILQFSNTKNVPFSNTKNVVPFSNTKNKSFKYENVSFSNTKNVVCMYFQIHFQIRMLLIFATNDKPYTNTKKKETILEAFCSVRKLL